MSSEKTVIKLEKLFKVIYGLNQKKMTVSKWKKVKKIKKGN